MARPPEDYRRLDGGNSSYNHSFSHYDRTSQEDWRYRNCPSSRPDLKDLIDAYRAQRHSERYGDQRRSQDPPNNSRSSRSSKSPDAAYRRHRSSSPRIKVETVENHRSGGRDLAIDEIRRKKHHKEHGHKKGSHSHKKYREKSISREPRRSRPENWDNETGPPVSKMSRKEPREVATVAPLQQSRIKTEQNDDDLKVVAHLNNKLRTQRNRLKKREAAAAAAADTEVITIGDEPPPSSFEPEPFNPIPNYPAPPEPPKISIASAETLLGPLIIKSDTEFMIPEDPPDLVHPPSVQEHSAHDEPLQTVHLPPFVPQMSIDDVDRKPMVYIPSVGIPLLSANEPPNVLPISMSSTVQFSSQPPLQSSPLPPSAGQNVGDIQNQSDFVKATCVKGCNFRLQHKCELSQTRRNSTLTPGELYTCCCGLIFLHANVCEDIADKNYVPLQKETGLFRQTDRAHTFQCHDCPFTFIIEGVKSGSHYFTKFTRRDGKLRDKKSYTDLTPFLKQVDDIARSRYPHEPRIVQERHADFRRTLIAQCNHNCCIIYHECTPTDFQDDDDT